MSLTAGRSFATVSLSVLKDLRSRSGAPMMECKKALESSDGDVGKAMDWLRKHGAAKASSKLQDREATEGLVGLCVSPDGASASLVQVSSETDFAGRSEAFCALVTHVADATLESNHCGLLQDDALMEATSNDKTVKEALDDAIVAIRENLRVTKAVSCQSEKDDGSQWVGYVHGRVGASGVVGTAAALVRVGPVEGKDVPDETIREAGKKLAMHVVAAKPLYLSPETVPEDAIEKERDILKEQVSLCGSTLMHVFFLHY